MSPWAKIVLILAAAASGFAAGHQVAALSGAAALSDKQGAWDKERAELAQQVANANNARMLAEHAKAVAIDQAAQSYEQGKTDAVRNADQALADLAAGNRRLRDQWATCRATTAAMSAAASGAGEPDGAAGLREDGIRRVLSAVGQCQAQRDALQQALMADRASN